MTSLILAGLSFVLLHLVMSSGPIRGPVARKLGGLGFQAAYALIILASFYWLVTAWREAPVVLVWQPQQLLRLVPMVIMPIAWILVVAGFTTPNPTSAAPMPGGMDGSEPVGVTKITRHPVLWGQGLWAVAHLPPNGDQAAIVFFGSFAALCLLGMLHIDRRRRARMGAAYRSFEGKTSLLPFAAILQGRTKLRFSEVGLARMVASIVLYVGSLHGHAWLTGSSAM